MSDNVYIVMSDEPEEIGVYTDIKKARDAKTQISKRSRAVVIVPSTLDAPPEYVGVPRSTL